MVENRLPEEEMTLSPGPQRHIIGQAVTKKLVGCLLSFLLPSMCSMSAPADTARTTEVAQLLLHMWLRTEAAKRNISINAVVNKLWLMQRTNRCGTGGWLIENFQERSGSRPIES